MTTPDVNLPSSRAPGHPKPPVTWHFLQVIGVCTCFVGYRMFDALPSKVAKFSAAYLVPFYAGMLLVVLPVLFVQLTLGGSTGRNMVALFSRSTPVLKGIAVACIFRMFIFTTYLNVLVAYSVYFAITSLTKPFLWAMCSNAWNNETCTNSTSSLLTGRGLPEQQFFDNKVLQLTTGISVEGSVDWSLGLSLFGVWLLTFVMVAGGIRVFAWLTSLFGLVAMVIAIALLAFSREELPHGNPERMLYRMEGQQLFKPSPTAAFLGIWLDGILEGVTVTYLWHGVLPTVGKYGCHGSNFRRNGMWVVLFVFFCAVPHLIINLVANILNPLVAISGISLSTLLESGARMLFVLLPAAFHHLELRAGVCFAFFFMVSLLLANTQALFSMVIVDNVGDCLRHRKERCFRRRVPRNALLTALLCLLGVAMSIPQITQGGYYFVQLIYLWTDRLLCVVVFFSMICYTESYVALHSLNFPISSKQPFGLCYRLTMLIWFVLASLFTTVMLTYKAEFHLEPRATTTRVRAGETYVYPPWASAIGWCIAGGPIILGLLYGFMHACAQVQGKQNCLAICIGQPGEDEENVPETKSNIVSQHLEGSIQENEDV